MRYNTELKKLIIPEYGRHIHEIIDNLCKIEDDKKRNEQAEITIQIMGNLNPHLRDVADFKHKLWDHLFIMSEHKLDVKSPHPKPGNTEINEKPELIKNNQGSVKYPHYGSFIISMIHEVGKMKDEDKKKQMSIGIANQMKKSYINWNQANIMDSFIINEINKISEGEINLGPDTVLASYNIIKPNQSNGTRRKSYTHSRGKKYSN